MATSPSAPHRSARSRMRIPSSTTQSRRALLDWHHLAARLGARPTTRVTLWPAGWLARLPPPRRRRRRHTSACMDQAVAAMVCAVSHDTHTNLQAPDKRAAC